jgi:hypothetical protein
VRVRAVTMVCLYVGSASDRCRPIFIYSSNVVNNSYIRTEFAEAHIRQRQQQEQVFLGPAPSFTARIGHAPVAGTCAC